MFYDKISSLDMLLVYPKATQKFDFCLGSAYVIAYLRQNGYTAEQYTTGGSVGLRECISQILSKSPRTVGFTVYDFNFSLCRLMAGAIKSMRPETVIIFGGPTPTVQAEAVLKNSNPVDICVRNEGEETAVELIDALDAVGFDLQRACFEKIKGITYKKDGGITNNPDRNTFLVNRSIPYYLDKFPSPYLSGVVGSNIGMLSARGCNQHCIYCNCAVLSKRTLTIHSIDRVLEELECISKISKNGLLVDIYDDAFTLMPGRALRICDRIIEGGIKVPLACMTRCDTVDENLLERMKEAGFKSIGFSLESAVPRLLRIIGKVQDPDTKEDDDFEKEKEFIEKFKRYVSYAKKIGIESVFASIMIGLPTETPEEARKTVDLIKSLEGRLECYTHNILQVLPGTPIFERHAEYGMELQSSNGVIYRTVHQYDPYKIKMASTSYVNGYSEKQGKSSLNAMTFSASGKDNPGWFNKVIVFSDNLRKEFILWLQECLAINGELIQVYSSLEVAKQNFEEDEAARGENNCITSRYTGYYEECSENGDMVLKPLSMYIWNDEDCGVPIKLANTRIGLSSSMSGVQPLELLCVERDQEDAYILHEHLVKLSREENKLYYLLNAPFYPYMAGLCKWEGHSPNCHSLEAVLVDRDNNVRPCWNGRPIGKVGMLLSEILANTVKIRIEAEKERGCSECSKREVCAKCLFTYPLQEREFCYLKKSCSVENEAGLFQTFQILKDVGNIL